MNPPGFLSRIDWLVDLLNPSEPSSRESSSKQFSTLRAGMCSDSILPAICHDTQRSDDADNRDVDLYDAFHHLTCHSVGR